MMVERFGAPSGRRVRFGILASIAVAALLLPQAGFAQGPAAPPDGAWALEAAAPLEAAGAERSVVATLIETRLTERALAVAGVDLPQAALRTVYEANGFTPLWTDESGAYLPRARALAEALTLVDREGLEPATYHPSLIASLLEATTPESVAEGELMLTATLIRYADHVRTGRIAPRSLSTEFDYPVRQIDAAEVALGAVRPGVDMDAYLASLAPQDRHYQGLRRALAAMRGIAEQGGWPEVPATATIRPDDESEAVPALRERLAAMGFYDGPLDPENRVYDEETVAALEAFQESYGLDVDGVIGPQTFGAIAGSVEDRIDQILASMERWRWLPDELGPNGRYVLVNIPGFEMQVYEGGSLVRDMRVIVGDVNRQTPLFSSALTWLEWNPTWTIPVSIAERDYLPQLIRDPSRLVNQNIRLYSSWGSDRYEIDSTTVPWSHVGRGVRSMMMRQEPGPGNALGKVKFMMGNNFSIYLHDTPSRNLFARSTRALSNGCIRLHDPLWFAEYLLEGNPHWTDARRTRVMGSWETTRINLDRPMPVHMVYMTAWWDEATEQPVFRGDIYGIDERVLIALDRFHAERMEVALLD